MARCGSSPRGAPDMAARDDYERYYTEKLWALIPEVYRTEDGGGTTADPTRQIDVLRQIIEVIAEQAAITRRSIDRLWEDQHVETSDGGAARRACSKRSCATSPAGTSSWSRRSAAWCARRIGSTRFRCRPDASPARRRVGRPICRARGRASSSPTPSTSSFTRPTSVASRASTGASTSAS